jgi:hypothetical protein
MQSVDSISKCDDRIRGFDRTLLHATDVSRGAEPINVAEPENAGC